LPGIREGAAPEMLAAGLSELVVAQCRRYLSDHAL
jgi:hypothetical protein